MANPAVSLDGERHPALFAAAVLDPEIICRLRELGDAVGEDLLLQLAALFNADANERIAELSHAFDHRDSAAVIRAAHTLRGSSANLGAVDLGRLCERIEAVGITGDLAAAGALLDALRTELGRVHEALAALMVIP
jgi:two-component system sensor histidine kinase/response regulator